MDINQIMKEVNDIFIDVMSNKKIKLESATTAKDVKEWDSLSNIHIILHVEQHFKIRFTSLEFQSWKNVGDMVACIEKKLIAKKG